MRSTRNSFYNFYIVYGILSAHDSVASVVVDELHTKVAWVLRTRTASPHCAHPDRIPRALNVSCKSQQGH